MPEDDSALAAEFAALKAAFRLRLAEDRAAFSAALPQPPAEQLPSLIQRAHRLAGAAGSFDEPGLSEAAQRFEELGTASSGSEPVAAALRELLRALERALAG
jgi:HPt (histidine-containing phosphotransfer) domain-containing protein